MNKTIYVNKVNGWLIIRDDNGNKVKYLYYSKREAIRRFKERFGYKNVRGVTIIEG